MESFKDKVLAAVKQVPSGKVASYGQIGFMIGQPRAGRQVGWILARFGGEDGVPWWRIVNNKGYLSIKNNEVSAQEQRARLLSEGVEVSENFEVEMGKFRWGYVENN